MKYNTRRWNPFLIAIPDIGIGMYWSLTGTIGSWIVYQHTNSSFLAGLLLSMAAFTGLFMQTLSGIASDKTPSHRFLGKRTTWLLVGLVSTCIFQMLWPFAPNYICLFIIAFLTYASINFFQGPYYTMVVEVVDRDQIPFATLLARTTAQIGTIIIGLIGAIIWNIGGAFLSCVIVCLLLIIPTLSVIPFIVKERPENQMTSAFKLSFDIFSDKNINLLFLATFCMLTGFGAFMPLMGGYMNHHLGFSKDFTASLVMTFGIGSVIVGLLATTIINLIKVENIFKIGLLIFAIALICGSFLTKENFLWYIITFVVAMGFILSQVSCYTLIAKLAPKDRLGEYMGWLNMFFSLPQLIILICGGVLIDSHLAPYLYWIAGIILLIGFVAVTQIKTNHQEN
ncbi:MFS transporter [Francisella sp. SYW-9]|uniref:MFS transporter n=1 Tax=Francisella sp. SYW-9 TaxID=2610888 RepID=UPI00123E026B|nr:MFS transporter [Francisella sp. SYW-9]